MPLTFSEVLAKLLSGTTDACEHLIGSAWFIDDEENYERLEAQFEEAVAAFTARFGQPIQPAPRFPGREIEKLACWERSDKVLFALLDFQDNTRIRSLTLGIVRRGEVVLKQ